MRQMTVPNFKTPETGYKIYQRFRGLDLSTDETQIDDSRSPKMVNMISDSGGYPEVRVGWRALHASHIVVCVYATDMLSFPFNCDDWNVIGSKLLGRKSMAQYNQTFNFISHQFIQVLLFQFLFVTAYEYKEFVVVVTVAGQKLIQHLRIVVQI